MVKLKLVPVGEGEAPARGIRLPERLLRRYGIVDSVAVELAPDGLILRPTRAGKLSWRSTAASMAKRGEKWNGWDNTLSDGLDTL
ncbi:hypothetical protein SAMN05444156_0223 [Verrucomicrobium sp. GAS474]|uniref:AbrB/MazE/SpoVT family DNA-binding domain-containing protein n=1 Tax=Verrucomicrobium sp. GAS474 TaxID=1882831 RepID=UPI00087D15AF|nr:hypothetical protein [Verrucomicrobium sp. GAS474]SDT86737.1 hypothetical protein SAMN05444156_0223 [Verrucomicrobium sp. GAS474]